jgi:hypothetical protein
MGFLSAAVQESLSFGPASTPFHQAPPATGTTGHVEKKHAAVRLTLGLDLRQKRVADEIDYILCDRRERRLKRIVGDEDHRWEPAQRFLSIHDAVSDTFNGLASR